MAEGQDVGLQALQVGVVEHLDGGVLHGPVHPLRLAVCPGMIGPGQLVGDPVVLADPVEDVPHPGRRWPVAVFGQVSECHAVVGQHGVDRIREHGHDLTRTAAPFILVAASKNATWVNVLTRSMARNMWSLPSLRRSSQWSMSDPGRYRRAPNP